MNLEELQEVLKKHGMWLNDEEGGERANLSRADLSDAELSDADLRGADLSDANLSRANLSRANLSRANLSRANLSRANLSDADLRLWDTVGNRINIKTISIETYTITYTKDRIQIGCKNYSIEEWFSFSDDEISQMDIGSLEWWAKWKEWLKQAIEMSPAE